MINLYGIVLIVFGITVTLYNLYVCVSKMKGYLYYISFSIAMFFIGSLYYQYDKNTRLNRISVIFEQKYSESTVSFIDVFDDQLSLLTMNGKAFSVKGNPLFSINGPIYYTQFEGGYLIKDIGGNVYAGSLLF
jgi:hypothetical protein